MAAGLGRSSDVALSLPFFRPSPESLVRKVEGLPKAPKVLHKLQELVVSPDATLEQIADVVKLEPGLSAHVMRMSRSTKFGRGAQSSNIVEAIQRVGLAGVHELVTYAVASQLVGQPLRGYGLDAQSLWSRAIACAIAASALAERGDVNRSDAYTAGLMHGIGLMVIDRHSIQQKSTRRLPSTGYPLDFAAAERDWLGFSHAEAGAALLEMWGFSAPVIAAVKYQLEPEADAEHRKLSMVLATARWARSLFCVPDENIPELPAALWLEEAGMPIADFGEWLGTVRRRYQITCGELRL
jgi:HD-like signal output (HDOD) protein